MGRLVLSLGGCSWCRWVGVLGWVLPALICCIHAAAYLSVISISGVRELCIRGGRCCDDSDEFLVANLQASEDYCHFIHVEVFGIRVSPGSLGGASSPSSWCATGSRWSCLKVGCDAFIVFQDECWWWVSEVGVAKKGFGRWYDAAILIPCVWCVY